MADVLGKRISELANNTSLAGTAVFPHTQGSSTMKVSLTNIAAFILTQLDQSMIDSAVADWLDQHPEATTTVEDGAITTAKLADGAVTSGKIADGTVQATDMNADFLDGICIRNNASGSVAHFNDGGKSLPLRDMQITIIPIQTGSGDPSPTNIRALTGWTAAKIFVTGKNLFDAANANWVNDYTITAEGVISSSSGYRYTSAFTRVKPNTTYTGQINVITTNARSFSAACYDENRTFLSRITVVSYTEINASTGIKSGTFTTPAGCAFIRLVSPKSTYISDYQIEEGSVATAYEAFGSVQTVTWEDGAGFVYGGTFDPITGILTAEYDILNIDGSKSVTLSDTNLFYYSLGAYGISPNLKGVNSVGWCSHYKLMTNVTKEDLMSNAFSTTYNNSSISSTNGRAFFYDTNYSTADDFKNYLISQNSNGTPVQYVFKLATPQQYQLTPIRVYAKDGINNVGADCGSTDVEYYANPKPYIADRETATRLMITGIEADYIATKNYSSGDLLIVGDTLYITTASIASGAALTPGTNITATTVAENLGGGGSYPSAVGVSF